MNPVVIDTNCLLQIIARKSPYRPIWEAFLWGFQMAYLYHFISFYNYHPDIFYAASRKSSDTEIENIIYAVEPASALLERIREEKMQLVNSQLFKLPLNSTLSTVIG